MSADRLLGNAATASQHLPLLDDPVVRGAVLRSIKQWLTVPARPLNIDDLIDELEAHEDFNN